MKRFLTYLVLTTLTVMASANADGTKITDSLDGYWLVMAAEFPRGHHLASEKGIVGKLYVTGKCQPTYCEAGDPADASSYGNPAPALFGRLNLVSPANGDTPAQLKFDGTVWKDLAVTKRFDSRKKLKTAFVYHTKLMLPNTSHSYHDEDSGPPRFYGNSAWLLVDSSLMKDPSLESQVWEAIYRP